MGQDVAVQERGKVPKERRGTKVGSRNARAEAIFLDRLREDGHVTRAAEASGVAYQAWYDRRKTDQEFRDRFEEARQVGVEREIERRIRPRGTTGWEEPVFQQGRRVFDVVTDAEGEVIYEEDPETGEKTPRLKPATITKYSDQAAQLWLRNHKPELFATSGRVEVTGKGGGPVRHAHLHANVRADDLLRELDDAGDGEVAAGYEGAFEGEPDAGDG